MRLNPNNSGSRRHDNLNQFKGKSGVYLIWKNRQVYIGSTRDLRSRLRAHTSRFQGWEFAVQELPIKQARLREEELIRKFSSKKFQLLNVNRVLESLAAHGVSRQLVYSRVKSGWTEERARTTPPRGYRG